MISMNILLPMILRNFQVQHLKEAKFVTTNNLNTVENRSIKNETNNNNNNKRKLYTSG